MSSVEYIPMPRRPPQVVLFLGDSTIQRSVAHTVWIGGTCIQGMSDGLERIFNDCFFNQYMKLQAVFRAFEGAGTEDFLKWIKHVLEVEKHMFDIVAIVILLGSNNSQFLQLPNGPGTSIEDMLRYLDEILRYLVTRVGVPKENILLLSPPPFGSDVLVPPSSNDLDEKPYENGRGWFMKNFADPNQAFPVVQGFVKGKLIAQAQRTREYSAEITRHALKEGYRNLDLWSFFANHAFSRQGHHRRSISHNTVLSSDEHWKVLQSMRWSTSPTPTEKGKIRELLKSFVTKNKDLEGAGSQVDAPRLTTDALHLNNNGYQLIEKAFLKAMLEVLPQRVLNDDEPFKLRRFEGEIPSPLLGATSGVSENEQYHKNLIPPGILVSLYDRCVRKKKKAPSLLVRMIQENWKDRCDYYPADYEKPAEKGADGLWHTLHYAGSCLKSLHKLQKQEE
ncbi:hypothetical protein T439DRAFT_320674 [Meredithblackwellia eburnea MCA 4105]